MKTVVLLTFLIIFSSLGEILSAHGMKQVGELSFQPRLLVQSLRRIFTNRSLFGGVVCLAVSFFSFLSLLSYADLSYVIPLTALSYLTNTLGSKFLLHEKISPARWWGTGFVTLGVAIISLPAGIETLVRQWLELLLTGLNPAGQPLTAAVSVLVAVRALLLVLVIAAIVYSGLALVAGWLWSRDRQRQRKLGTSFVPPVSLLIPVRGADGESYDNFASLCRQDYPDLQLVFGCREANDPAVPIIHRLQQDFPTRKIELVIADHEIGTNAKVSNLNNMYPRAVYDYLLIVDSDIRVEAHYLRRVVAPLQQPHVGMVTCLYRGAKATTFASLLENIGIAATFGPEVMSSRALEGIKFALGSTIVVRREVFDRIGGFAVIADYLADDFWLGNRVAAAGYEVVLSDCVVDHIATPDTMRTMLKHQLRWGRSVRVSRPKGFAGLILTYGIATSLLLLLALGGSTFGWVMLSSAWLLRWLTAFYCGGVLMQDRVLLRYLWLVPLRDLLGFGVWIASFIGSQIHWRGHQFVVLPSGKIKPVAEPTSF